MRSLSNKLEFLYGDVIGLFDGQGSNMVDEHCTYIMDESGGIYTDFLDTKERTIFEDKFLSLYSNINFNHYEDSNVLGVHCGIINHDYSSNSQQYNMISENMSYLEHEDEVIKKMNDNIDIYNGVLYNSDIRDILSQYGVAGGLLELKKWVCSEIHGIPTLEGMNMDIVLFSKIS